MKSGCCIPSAPCTTGQFEASAISDVKKWVGGAIIILPPPHLTNSHPDDPRHIIVSEIMNIPMKGFFKTLPFQLDHMIE